MQTEKEMSLPSKKILYLNAILLGIVLIHAMYRDFQLERQYPADLRNRVVGARLQKNNIGPYTYFWQPADGMRYFDPSNYNIDAQHASNITASPFFHEIFYPLASLPQRQVSRIWCWLQYLFLGCIIGMTCALTTDKTKKWIIVNVGVLFTLTEAWKDNIGDGQLYLFEAFLMGCILFFLIRNKKYGLLTAGILAAAFVLTRPYAVVIFIPFLFYYKRYLIFLMTAFTGLLFYGVFVLSNSNEKAIYVNYQKGMQMQVKFHQSANPVFVKPVGLSNIFSNLYPDLEGFKKDEVAQYYIEHPIPVYNENGNVFVIYNKLTHKQMPLNIIYIIWVSCILLFSGFFFFYIRKSPSSPLQVVLFSFTLYMIVELFSPIYRHQYNSVQWFPLVLAAILIMPGEKSSIFFLIIAGLLLHISNIPWPLMRHTLGEFCWLIALLLSVFSSRLNVIPWKKQ
jgi:hypothetical protein